MTTLVLDAEALYQELLRGVRQLHTPGTQLVGITSGGAWLAERLQAIYPDAIIGGTGWDDSETALKVEDIGIHTQEYDYSFYPRFRDSIGYTQRGCRMKCSFCCVPRKEGGISKAGTVYDIWRGDPYPRHLLLLDNDFFGEERWPLEDIPWRTTDDVESDYFSLLVTAIAAAIFSQRTSDMQALVAPASYDAARPTPIPT